MSQKGCLVHSFTGSSSGKYADDKNFPCPAGLPLTAGEVALVQSIFGDEIKTKRIRKYFSAAEKPGRDKGYVIPAQTFGKYSIKFYGSQYQSVDYSRSTNVFNFGTFIHEMTHIWQNQHNIPSKPLAKGASLYQYILTPHAKFDDFGWEQQAKIIEDYTLQHLHSNRPANTDPLLQKVVEERFPEARKTRLTLEAKKTPSVKKTPKFG